MEIVEVQEHTGKSYDKTIPYIWRYAEVVYERLGNGFAGDVVRQWIGQSASSQN